MQRRRKRKRRPLRKTTKLHLPLQQLLQRRREVLALLKRSWRRRRDWKRKLDERKMKNDEELKKRNVGLKKRLVREKKKSNGERRRKRFEFFFHYGDLKPVISF